MSLLSALDAFCKDRTREQQLLTRCLELEQQLHVARTELLRRGGASDWPTGVVTDMEIAQFRDIGKLTFRQIALRLGMPESTAAYRYKRSRRVDGPR